MTELEKLNQLHVLTQHLIGLQEAQASYIAIFLSGVFAFILAAHSAGASVLSAGAEEYPRERVIAWLYAMVTVSHNRFRQEE